MIVRLKQVILMELEILLYKLGLPGFELFLVYPMAKYSYSFGGYPELDQLLARLH